MSRLSYNLFKIIIVLTISFLLILFTIQVSIYFNLDLFSSFTVYCVEYPSTNTISTIVKINDDNVTYVIENKINTYIEIKNEEAERLEEDEETKAILKWGIPCCVIITIWTFYWCKVIMHLIVGK